MGIWRYDGQTAARRTEQATSAGQWGVGHGGARGTHVPVLLERCLELLAPALDRPGRPACTSTPRSASAGTPRRCSRRTRHAVLVGLDRDTEALAHAGERLAAVRRPDPPRARGLRRAARRCWTGSASTAVDGVLFDLGVSSLQLDEPDRGFAYAQDAPLDMRMDQTRGIDRGRGGQHVRRGGDLARVLRVYGEEKFATRIASAIVRERERNRSPPSARLAELVRDAIPAPARRTGGNPAKSTFQALRIEVNGELSALEAALPAALDALAPGGRIVVLSYHSLEDRIAKRAFAERARATGPVDLPVELPGTGPTLRLLTRRRGARRGGGGGEPARRVGAPAGRGTDRARRCRPRTAAPAGQGTAPALRANEGPD